MENRNEVITCEECFFCYKHPTKEEFYCLNFNGLCREVKPCDFCSNSKIKKE